MSEEKKTFKIGGEDYPVIKPRGMHGVRAVNYVFAQIQKSGDDTIDAITRMFDHDDFWGRHLPALLHVDMKVIEQIDYPELLTAVLTVVGEITEGFTLPEVEEAVKNSAGTPEEDQNPV